MSTYVERDNPYDLTQTGSRRSFVTLTNFFWYYGAYRIVITFLMTFYVGGLTSLGDSPKYLAANPLAVLAAMHLRTFTDATSLLEFLVGLTRSIVQIDVIVHLIFGFIAFAGIRELLIQIAPRRDLRGYLLLGLVLSPSFNLWSSIVGKEALIVFAGGIICSRMIQYLVRGRARLDWKFWLSMYLVIVIKAPYTPAIVQFFLYLWVVRKLGLRAVGAGVLAVMVALINLAIIYALRDFIDFYAMHLYWYFDTKARSTRANPFLQKGDVFRLLPYGMFIGLWGPTYEETKISVLHLFSFFESAVIFGTWAFLLFRLVTNLFVRFEVQPRRTFVLLNSTLWLLFMQYIQGILNSGSAIRYRTNIFPFLITFLYLTMSNGYDVLRARPARTRVMK